MADVSGLGRPVVLRGSGGGARWGRRFSWIAVFALLALAPIVRAAEGEVVEWVGPASLDAVPVRAMEIGAPDAAAVPEVAPKPIVVPLPSGLETGGAFLAALAAARWWSAARRRQA